MALFNRLLNLHSDRKPTEDFFTEIVAHLFRTHPDVMFAWLERINIINVGQYLYANVSTQQSFGALEHHDVASRPDIVIELSDGTQSDVVFIESKIGSEEHSVQLQRYAEILLNEYPDANKKILLYVTRDFDPKDAEVILTRVADSVQFKQVRWWTLHQVLKSKPNNTLIEEIIAFMEEIQMMQNSKFTPDDMNVLSNLSRAYILVDELMDATMGGKVQVRFQELMGTIDNIKTTFDQLKEHRRYLMYAWLPANKPFAGLWCGLGYHPEKSPSLTYHPETAQNTDYPTVGLVLEVTPTAKQRQQIIRAMQEIINERPGWRGYHLEKQNTWSTIVRERNLRDFLSEDDQVVAISSYFLQILNELADIKKQYPMLPWA